MFYRTIEIDEMFTDKEANHEIVEIMSNNEAQLKLVYLKKHEGFDSHKFNTNVCIYLIEGELEMLFTKESICGCNICGAQIPDEHDDKKQKYKIKKGQLFIFEKDIFHSVKALKDSKFLLIKI